MMSTSTSGQAYSSVNNHTDEVSLVSCYLEAVTLVLDPPRSYIVQRKIRVIFEWRRRASSVG